MICIIINDIIRKNKIIFLNKMESLKLFFFYCLNLLIYKCYNSYNVLKNFK